MCVLSFNFMSFRYLFPEQGWSYAVISTKREIYACISGNDDIIKLGS